MYNVLNVFLEQKDGWEMWQDGATIPVGAYVRNWNTGRQEIRQQILSVYNSWQEFPSAELLGTGVWLVNQELSGFAGKSFPSVSCQEKMIFPVRNNLVSGSEDAHTFIYLSI
jgi:hypothetical protein